MKINNLFLEQVLTRLKEGQQYSHLPFNEDKSCILIALEHKDYDTAYYMINKMTSLIDMQIINKECWLDFTQECKNSHLDEIIIELGADINKSNCSIEPIIQAILNNNKDSLNYILSNEVFTREQLEVYLQLCCQKNAFNCIERLLLEGASLEHKGITGNTPLLSAIEHRSEQAARKLIYYGANVNATNIEDISPLILAVSKQLICVCEELLINGADINHMPYLGETALMLIARMGDKDFCTFLLDYCPQLEKRNHLGKTAMDIAIECNQNAVANALKVHGAKCDSILCSIKSNIIFWREKILEHKNLLH